MKTAVLDEDKTDSGVRHEVQILRERQRTSHMVRHVSEMAIEGLPLVRTDTGFVVKFRDLDVREAIDEILINYLVG